MAIAYVEHPITKEEKKTILREGFDRIIDVQFKPQVLEDGDKVITKAKAK